MSQNKVIIEHAGLKLKELRLALGYRKRPEFAELFGMPVSRLQTIEQAKQKMNQDDFRVIYDKWPWALGFLLGNEPLVVPEGYSFPLNESEFRSVTEPGNTNKNNNENSLANLSPNDLKEMIRETIKEELAKDNA